MESKKSRFRIHWFWGFVGCCGSLGLILGEPGYYAFFSFFLFFAEPLVIGRESKKMS